MLVQETARFERAGDERRMSVGLDDGGVVITEDLSGPSVLLVYGEREHRLRMTLSPDAVSRLVCEVGFLGGEDSLWRYLSSEEKDIVDLMDLCDRRGIPYGFVSSGSVGGCRSRLAAVG